MDYWIQCMLITGLIGLGGCEFVKDTGEVCLVPQQVECTCHEGESLESEWDCGLPDRYRTDDYSCRGTYPADVSYTIDARLYDGGNGYAVKEKCKVSLDGDRLHVKAQFWHKPEQDSIVEPPAHANCEVGPLAAGTYVLEYGDNEIEVEIGDATTVQPMACVASGTLHDGYAVE